MRITITLSDKDGGTEVVGVHEALPPGVSIADNEAGWRMALGKLAALVEANPFYRSHKAASAALRLRCGSEKRCATAAYPSSPPG